MRQNLALLGRTLSLVVIRNVLLKGDLRLRVLVHVLGAERELTLDVSQLDVPVPLPDQVLLLLNPVSVVLPRHRFDASFEHLPLESLDVLCVGFARVQHFVLFLHDLAHVKERAQLELGVRLVLFFCSLIGFDFVPRRSFRGTCLQLLLCLSLVLGPCLHFVPTFLLRLGVVLLEHVRFEDSLLEKLVLPQQLVHDLLAESKLVHAVLKALLLEIVASTDPAVALDSQVPLA